MNIGSADQVKGILTPGIHTVEPKKTVRLKSACCAGKFLAAQFWSPAFVMPCPSGIVFSGVPDELFGEAALAQYAR